ncbi:hypothetical protein RFI_18704 [Reticulomyxa filosa]|uniref:uDENN domain-containing protein n=1 Tax=Reticulomyxa filosa TaxID=46433 RepID=X6MYK1_RETFI|nr:hypothetical protein RFI_18704 [Reticulomyxa filosa]|eukprot:ETO18562.1 hypothetical protein RFI_18704 [Reticulomyxa filosa]
MQFITQKYVDRVFASPRTASKNEEAIERLADYFLIIGHKEMILPEIQDVESDNSPPHQVSSTYTRPVCPFFLVNHFETFVVELKRYPLQDYPECPLATRVYDFVFPEPIEVREEGKGTEVRGFVLTDAQGTRQYGSALVFWERLSPVDIITMSEKVNDFRVKKFGVDPITEWPEQLYAPVAIAVISHWPFFS